MARGWHHPKAHSCAGLPADAGGQTGPHRGMPAHGLRVGLHAFTDDIRVLRVSISEEQVRNVWHFADVVSDIA